MTLCSEYQRCRNTLFIFFTFRSQIVTIKLQMSQVLCWKMYRTFLFCIYNVVKCLKKKINTISSIETRSFHFLWIIRRFVLPLLFLRSELKFCFMIENREYATENCWIIPFMIIVYYSMRTKRKTKKPVRSVSFSVLFYWLHTKHIYFDTNNKKPHQHVCAKCQVNTNTFNRL